MTVTKQDLSPRQRVARKNLTILASIVTRAEYHLREQELSVLQDVELDCNDISITIRHPLVDGISQTTIYTATIEP